MAKHEAPPPQQHPEPHPPATSSHADVTAAALVKIGKRAEKGEPDPEPTGHGTYVVTFQGEAAVAVTADGPEAAAKAAAASIGIISWERPPVIQKA